MKKFLINLVCILIITLSISAEPAFARLLDNDTSTWNPNLKPVELVDENNEEITLNNIRWGSTFKDKEFHTQFKQAIIRYGEVEQVFFNIEDFPPKFLASHVSLAFTFKSDNGIITADATDSDRGLVISITNRLRSEDSGRSLTKAFFPKRVSEPWPILYEVGTLSDRVQNSITILGRSVRMYPLNLNPNQAEKVLRKALELSLVDRSNDFYHLITNNCIVHAFKILKAAFGNDFLPNFKVANGRFINSSYSLPRPSENFIVASGIAKNQKTTLEKNARTVSIPSPSSNIEIDLTTMPGYGRATCDVIPFVIALEEYLEFAKATKDLNKILNVTNPSLSDFTYVLNTITHVNEHIDNTVEGMIAQIQKDPRAVLTFYADKIKQNEKRNISAFKTLNQSLKSVFNFHLSHVNKNSDPEFHESLVYLMSISK